MPLKPFLNQTISIRLTGAPAKSGRDKLWSSQLNRSTPSIRRVSYTVAHQNVFPLSGSQNKSALNRSNTNKINECQIFNPKNSTGSFTDAHTQTSSLRWGQKSDQQLAAVFQLWYSKWYIIISSEQLIDRTKNKLTVGLQWYNACNSNAFV